MLMHVNQDSSVSLRNLSFHETAMLKGKPEEGQAERRPGNMASGLVSHEVGFKGRNWSSVLSLFHVSSMKLGNPLSLLGIQ